MQIPVLIEPVATNGFRARSGEPFVIVTEGATEDEAVQKLRDQIAARLASGSKLITIEVGDSSNPWMRVAGMFKDDPLFEEWVEAMAENRRQMDADPNVR